MAYYQNERVSRVTDSEFEMEDCIIDLMEADHVPGLAVAYRKPGGQEQFLCFGNREAIRGQAINEHTLFEVCSLTKPLFALYVLDFLRELGVSLDDPILSLLPEANKRQKLYDFYINNEKLQRVTFRQVLSHSSGLPNWGREDELELKMDPGKYFSYSGEGYMLVQRLMQEHISVAIEKDIRSKILLPLGMKHSTLVWSGPAKENVALGHDEKGNQLTKRQWTLNGAASLHASLKDYWEFCKALLYPDRIFGPLFEVMKQPVIPVNYNSEWDGRYHEDMERKVPGLFWGSGIGIEESSEATRYFHWGHQSGYRSLFCVDSGGGAVLLLCNGSNIEALRRYILHSLGMIPGSMIEWLELE